MLISEELHKISKLMNLFEEKGSKSNLFKEFDLNQFKDIPPPSDNSKETKKELDYLKSIDLKKRFVQKNDDIDGNFINLLKSEGINDTKLIFDLHQDARYVITELKNYYKRPRPFRLDPKLVDPMLKSMEGFSYPSGHSTQSNLLYFVLSEKYPNLKKKLKKVKDDIVYSRQMAKAHYPSDIRFGEILAKSMFEHLKNNKKLF
jgi:hypothetical protein